MVWLDTSSVCATELRFLAPVEKTKGEKSGVVGRWNEKGRNLGVGGGGIGVMEGIVLPGRLGVLVSLLRGFWHCLLSKMNEMMLATIFRERKSGIVPHGFEGVRMLRPPLSYNNL